jgi:hypothetical protein
MAVHREDFIVKPSPFPLVLPDNLRLEFPFPIPRTAISIGPWSVLSVFVDFPFLRLPLGFSPALLFW